MLQSKTTVHPYLLLNTTYTPVNMYVLDLVNVFGGQIVKRAFSFSMVHQL